MLYARLLYKRLDTPFVMTGTDSPDSRRVGSANR
jgi:hypothetical protein